MLKALLVLEIFKFLPWLFVRVKNDMIRKLSLISKFMTSQTEQQNNYNTPITQYLKTTRQWKLLSWRRNAQHYKLVLKPHINSKIIFIQNKYPYTAQQYWEKASKYSYILPVLGQLPPRKIVLQPEILRVGLSISQALTVTGGQLSGYPFCLYLRHEKYFIIIIKETISIKILITEFIEAAEVFIKIISSWRLERY